MEAIAAILILVSVAVFVLGVVNLIKPMAWMKVRKRHIGALMVLGSFGGCIAGGSMMPPSATPATEIDEMAAQQSASSEAAAEPAAVVAEPKLTGPQKNAVRSARQYLSLTGFSRDGLIEQLSSDYGEGYDEADATIAVDSLDVDWNENAVRSAKQYLELTGFSCKGLIEQLSSSAGGKFTESQARHGAQAAGAC